MQTLDSTIRLLARLVLLIQIVCWRHCYGARADPLQSGSFKLQTRIKHHSENKVLRIYVSERYSRDQARGLIEYQASGLEGWPTSGTEALPGQASGSFWVEARKSADELLTVSTTSPDGCALVNASSLIEFFRLDSFMLTNADEEAARKGGNPHLIGPAKWISYIIRRRSLMRTTLGSSRAVVNNMPSIKYSILVSDKSGYSVDVSVFYSEISLEPRNHDDALPTRFIYRAQGITTIIDIGSFEQLPGDTLSPMTTGSRGDIHLDAFALTPASGCSQALFRSRSEQDEEPVRLAASGAFSFAAKVSHWTVGAKGSSRQFEASVAYEGRLNAMRVDLDLPYGPIKRVHQVFNFYRNRMYHLSSGLPEGANVESEDQDENLGGVAGSSKNLRRCVSAKICSAECGNLTLGQLLWGADDFVYLGLAMVRGVRARVYEALNTELPNWLEQPIHFEHTKLDGREERKSTATLREDSRKLVTVIYLTDEPNESQQRLLLFEIFDMNSAFKVLFNKQTLEVYDFAWSLNAIFLDNDESSLAPYEMFSLADQCSASIGDARHSQVHLLLQSTATEDVNNALLAHRAERNLATLAALQLGLDLVLSMIYDLETRVIKLGEMEGDEKAVKLLVSFNMAKHMTVTNNMLFLGLGTLPESGRTRNSQFITYETISFHHCFLIAAHFNDAGTYFGFEPRWKTCHICTHTSSFELPPVPSGDKHNEAKSAQESYTTPFEMSADKGELEVYLTRPVRDAPASLSTWTHDEAMRQKKQTGIRDNLLVLRQAGKPSVSAVFAIQRLSVRAHGSQVASERTGVQSNRVSKIEGFGLSGEQKVGQLLRLNPETDKVGERHVFVMTQSRCQAACLANLECLSFSYCVRGAEAECLLSKFDLSSPEFARRIFSVGRHSTLNARLLVDLDEGGGAGSVSVVKHPGCSLHTKRYLEHFANISPPLTTNQLRNVLVKPVTESEDCARWCYMRNVDFQRGRGRRIGTDADVFKITSNLTGCYSFGFIDRLNLQLQNDETIARWEATVSAIWDRNIGGFCAIETRPDYEDSIESFKLDKQLTLERYSLRVEDFYDETLGVTLRGSELTTDERRAYEDVSSGATPSPESIEIARNLLARGENFQMVMFGSRSTCAKWCFSQSSILWPSCQSFDLIIRAHTNTGISPSMCVLHSITLRQALAANRFDLIDSSSNLTINDPVRWHYDIKSELWNEFGEIKEEKKFSGSISRLSKNSQAFTAAQHDYRALAAILFSGIGSGLFLGAILAETLKSWLEKWAARPRFGSDTSTSAVLDLPEVPDGEL